MAGMMKKLSNSAACVFTGKGLSFGGSLIRPEATGYGTVYFAQEMLMRRGRWLRGHEGSVSGSGNVAQYAVEKAMALGAKVITVSDSERHGLRRGGLHGREARGADGPEERALRPRRRIREARSRQFDAGSTPLARPGRTSPCPAPRRTNSTREDAQTLVKNGVICVAEGANMPSTTDAVHVFDEGSVLYRPGKASNAGGVATSGLEMCQNAMRLCWPREEVERGADGSCAASTHPACTTGGATTAASTMSTAPTSPASSRSPMRCWRKA